MWLIILSDQLPVFALVGRYPTNKLIGRRLILKCDLHRFNTSEPTNVRYLVLTPVSRRYLSLEGRSSTRYSPVRRSLPKQLARLACIKHAASVRPEPGSNSPVKSFSHFSKVCLKTRFIRCVSLFCCSVFNDLSKKRRVS